jgi:FCD domain
MAMAAQLKPTKRENRALRQSECSHCWAHSIQGADPDPTAGDDIVTVAPGDVAAGTQPVQRIVATIAHPLERPGGIHAKARKAFDGLLQLDRVQFPSGGREALACRRPTTKVVVQYDIVNSSKRSVDDRSTGPGGGDCPRLACLHRCPPPRQFATAAHAHDIHRLRNDRPMKAHPSYEATKVGDVPAAMHVVRVTAVDETGHAIADVGVLGSTLAEPAYHAAVVIEPAAAEYAASRIDDEHLDQLADNVARMEGMVRAVEHGDQVDTDAFVSLDGEFHEIISESTNNRVLALSREPVARLFIPAGRVILPRLRTHRRVVEAHVRILEALRDHDPAVVREWMRRHMEDFKRGYEATGMSIDLPLDAAALGDAAI